MGGNLGWVASGQRQAAMERHALRPGTGRGPNPDGPRAVPARSACQRTAGDETPSFLVPGRPLRPGTGRGPNPDGPRAVPARNAWQRTACDDTPSPLVPSRALRPGTGRGPNPDGPRAVPARSTWQRTAGDEIPPLACQADRCDRGPVAARTPTDRATSRRAACRNEQSVTEIPPPFVPSQALRAGTPRGPSPEANLLSISYAGQDAPHWAGMVISGSFSVSPLSARVKKNMMAVRARLVFRSPSSIQNQCPRYETAAKASSGFPLPL